MDWFMNNVGWKLIYSVVATIATGYLGWRLQAAKRVLKEAKEFVDCIDIATRPDSEGGEKITFTEGKRIAYEGKDVILALKELFNKNNG